MTTWKKPRIYKPLKNNGLLVLESDDGNEGDYSRWFPLFKEISYEYSQFYPFDKAPATLNVNSSTIGNNSGDRRKMTVEQLHELEKANWEIGSHGRHHIGVGEQHLLENTSIGTTTLKISYPLYIIEHQRHDHRLIYEYQIKEGSKIEKFRVRDGNISKNEIYLDKPLSNNYTTEAKVGLTLDSYDELLKGGRDDVISWGLECESFAYTWHDGASHNESEVGMNKVAEFYSSGRGLQGFTHESVYDIRRLKSYPDRISKERLSEYLDHAQNTNQALIVFGHGDHNRGLLSNMEHVVRGAFERNMPIMTRRDMVRTFLS